MLRYSCHLSKLGCSAADTDALLAFVRDELKFTSPDAAVVCEEDRESGRCTTGIDSTNRKRHGLRETDHILFTHKGTALKH